MGGPYDPDDRVVRIWDADSGQQHRILDPGEPIMGKDASFTAAGELLFTTTAGLRRWDPDATDSELLVAGKFKRLAATADGRKVLLAGAAAEADGSGGDSALLVDLSTGATKPLISHGDRVSTVAVGRGRNLGGHR